MAVESGLSVVALSAVHFCERVAPLLATREAENGLPWGTAVRLAAKPEEESPRLLLAVEEAGQIVGAAVWTPPYEVAATRLPAGAAKLVAERCLASGFRVPGASGPGGTGLELAREFARLTGATVTVRMAQKVYELVAVNGVPRARGNMRQAEAHDVALVADWYVEFMRETNLPNQDGVRESATRAITSGSAFLWQDDGTVLALACLSRETPNGRAIGPVYTPPHARRRGYATSLVADLSQRILADGKRFAVLFADTNNPTSNHIYESIGFRVVCDYDAYSIVPPT